MITGAVIGFLLWVAYFIVAAAHIQRSYFRELDVGKAFLALIIFVGVGASIGWLL